MTHFRRELLIERGPGRLVFEFNPERFAGAEVFYVEREGAQKQVPQLYTLEHLDWLISCAEDLALRDDLQATP